MVIEFDDIAIFDQHLRDGGSLAGVVLQGLDLRERTRELLAADLTGTVFLGGRLEAAAEEHARAAGALLFPTRPGVPYQLYRRRLYTVDELYDAFQPERPESYEECLDHRVYRHFVDTGRDTPPSILETLSRRLHDHGIGDAQEELLEPAGVPRRVVAIMGGHSMPRGRGRYLQVAGIARELTRRGFFMVSGGGPGAMEATHLGAYFACRPETELEAAADVLAEAPLYNSPAWLSQAFEVRRRFPLPSGDLDACASLGIPTWLYGHEPPNVFATHIAKYFSNAVREDGLLTIAHHGVVFSPGSAGTIQEIFQDACQNHYRKGGRVSPMVFLDRAYWTRDKAVYPLLEALARGKDYAQWLSITDDPTEVVERLVAYSESSSE